MQKKAKNELKSVMRNLFFLAQYALRFSAAVVFFFSLRPLFKWTGLCQLLHPPGRAFLRKVLSVLIPSFVNNNNVSKILNWSRDRFLIYICTERKIYLCDGKVFFTESDWVKLGLIKRFWKLLTYTSPNPTLKLTSHLGQNVGLGEG